MQCQTAKTSPPQKLTHCNWDVDDLGRSRCTGLSCVQQICNSLRYRQQSIRYPRLHLLDGRCNRRIRNLARENALSHGGALVAWGTRESNASSKGIVSVRNVTLLYDWMKSWSSYFKNHPFSTSTLMRWFPQVCQRKSYKKKTSTRKWSIYIGICIASYLAFYTNSLQHTPCITYLEHAYVFFFAEFPVYLTRNKEVNRN